MSWKRAVVIVFLSVFMADWAKLVAAEAKPSAEELDNKVKDSRLLIPEGFVIIDRRAKLVRHPGEPRWFLMFENRDKGAKKEEKKAASVEKLTAGEGQGIEGIEKFDEIMEVLPGRYLTVMTTLTGNKVDLSITFRIWGEVTVYSGRNFIFPTLVAHESLFGKSVKGGRYSTGGGGREIGSLGNSPLGSRGKEGEGVVKEKRKNMLTGKMRQALLAIPRTHVMEIPANMASESPDQIQSSVVDSIPKSFKTWDKKKKWREGQSVIDRKGRLVFEGEEQKYMFFFEADGASLSEPPVFVHPSMLLEIMERMGVRNATRAIKFRISGRVSNFQGKSYILFTKVVKVHEWGNLGK